MRTERPRLALAVLALALLSGCGANDDEAPKTPRTATGSLEQLAEQAECDPNVQTDADELRQANCKTADGRYILTTFATDRGLREWINEANDYGGSYLVGRKWVASGDAEVVETLRGRLGGTVETAPEHHSGSGDDDSGTGGSGESEGGEGHKGHHDKG
ncbi:hypothetical protein [Streptomyces sp. IB2014 016-6]|uniref:hypothetical protein n=1 Tax=Streptomyces sp. IB2014 016-6 TaxID=2517818 RepID=UPI00164F5791|nr:hypothetical protein [Streptomyces sp. IB2014 016-6]